MEIYGLSYLRHIALWVKILADDILKYFLYFFQKKGFQQFMQIISLG